MLIVLGHVVDVIAGMIGEIVVGKCSNKMRLLVSQTDNRWLLVKNNLIIMITLDGMVLCSHTR